MRFVASLIVALLMASSAMAQSWKEYAYPQYSFAVSFPSEPTVETKPYQAADGSMVNARIYQVARNNVVLRMTVADLSSKDMEEKAVIDHAIQALKADGEIKVDIEHRISAVYGRQLSITGKDGAHSSIAVFYHQRRLYQIEGVALPKGEDGTADAIRFQQSLVFTNNQSNRSSFERLFQVAARVFN
jgi:hypothetical protein